MSSSSNLVRYASAYDLHSKQLHCALCHNACSGKESARGLFKLRLVWYPFYNSSVVHAHRMNLSASLFGTIKSTVANHMIDILGQLRYVQLYHYELTNNCFKKSINFEHALHYVDIKT